MALNLNPNWRRTVLALAFAGAGIALTAMAIWLASRILSNDWPAYLAADRLSIAGNALMAVLALIGLVLTGLGMTVALRQVSAKFLWADFTASGGADDGK